VDHSRLDTILIGFHETVLPPSLAALPADDPLGFYYRTAFLRWDGAHLEPHVALSRLTNAATGRDDLYHWSEATPLALHHLTATLRRQGFQTAMFPWLEGEHDRLAQLLDRAAPRSVCLTTTFYVDPLPLIEAVSFIRRHNDQTTIILGGPFVQDLCRDHQGRALSQLLEALGADVVVRSAGGERTLARVLHALRDGTDLGQVPNLAVLERGTMLGLTATEPERSELDEPLDWDQITDEELGREVCLRTSVGCAHSCAFCEFPVRAGAHRLAALAGVERQIQQLARRQVRHVCFVDDALNVPPKRLDALCRTLIDGGAPFRWSAHFRAAQEPRPERFRRLKDSGCAALHLGVESGDDEMLRRMSKSGRVAHYERALELCRDNGILSHAALLVGFPGETAQSLERTIDFVNRTQPTTFKPQPFFYHHHAPVHRQAAALGLHGRGWRWRHHTMTSRQAFAAAGQVRHRVKGSSFVGDRQMHLFMLPWLQSKGMSTDQLVTALRLFDELQRDSFDARALGQHSRGRRKQRRAELTALCASLQLEPARFSMAVVDRYPHAIEAAMDRRQIFVELGALPDGAPARATPKPAE